MTKQIILYGFPHPDSETAIPTCWCICGQCQGHGKSSAYLGAYTHEQLADEGPEFIEDYIAGEYDRACDHCGGSGKILTPDRKAMSTEMRKAWDVQAEDERAERAAERAEYLFCGGWREEMGRS